MAPAGVARAAPVRGPQTAVAVRPRVAAQRAVFRIVCFLPQVSMRDAVSDSDGSRTGERESAESAAELPIGPTGFSNLAY
ncbi:hypothetical protein GCM10014715_34560 [Streptomyces spiralis]|uniref:Uncharacterized protein n=1 Tax=Streptomyces spiralis TaxID=66376 RepID=A0A918ZXT2_9ACTN|nr:hypothetical protein GCM10014715_34560 [Streptomyces spiralis]